MRIPITVAAILVALCLTSPAHAQSANQATSQPTSELVGTVVSTGNLSIVVQADDGRQKAFVVVNTTRLPAQPMAAGERIVVRYRPLGPSRAEALSIDREPGSPSGPEPFGK